MASICACVAAIWVSRAESLDLREFWLFVSCGFLVGVAVRRGGIRFFGFLGLFVVEVEAGVGVGFVVVVGRRG